MTKKATKLKNRRTGLCENDMLCYWTFRWRNIHGELTACVGAFVDKTVGASSEGHRLDIWAGFAFGNPKDMGLPRDERARHSAEIASGRLFAPPRLSAKRDQIPFVLIRQIFRGTPHDPNQITSQGFSDAVKTLVLDFVVHHGYTSFGIPWSSGKWDDRERDFVQNFRAFQSHLALDEFGTNAQSEINVGESVVQC